MKPELLDILVCPLTRTKLRYDEAAQELVSDEAGLAYPVRGGVPVMLVEEARPVVPPHVKHGEGDQPWTTRLRVVDGGVEDSVSEGPA